MAENAQPSLDPADDGHMAGMVKSVLNKFLQNIDDMLPATVVSFDRASNRATVQPMVMMLTTSDETVARAPIASVPVLQMGGGGYMLNFNLKPGDFGWIKASDRDISLFMQSMKQAGPNTLRKHSFSDGLFLPDVMRGYTIADEDAENAVLQNLAGTCRVAIWPDRVKVTAPLVAIEAASTTVSGNLAVTGGLVVGMDAMIGGRSFAGHVHSGVQTGPSNTGVRV